MRQRFKPIIKVTFRRDAGETLSKIMITQALRGKNLENNKHLKFLRKNAVNIVRDYYLATIKAVGDSLDPSNPFHDAGKSGTRKISFSGPDGKLNFTTATSWAALSPKYRASKKAHTRDRFWANGGGLFLDFQAETSELGGTDLVKLERKQKRIELSKGRAFIKYSLKVERLPGILGTYITASFMRQTPVNIRIAVQPTPFTTWTGKAGMEVYGINQMVFAEAKAGSIKPRLHRPFVAQLSAMMGKKAIDKLSRTQH